MSESFTRHGQTSIIAAPRTERASSRQCSGAPQHPSLTTTVPKEFVHRAAVAEVLLTGWERTGDTRFTVLAQWPRSHSFFTPVRGSHHDPMIALETIRQIGPLLGHAGFDVPLDHKFLMWDIDATVNPEELLVGDAPASLEIEVECSNLTWRGSRLTGLTLRTVIRRDGRIAATGGGSLTCLAPAVYQRLRHGRTHARPMPLTAPTAPQTVGRISPMDVVLSPIGEPDCWQLRVDTRHPVLFDHPLDHVPGMLLLEAARQATAALAGRDAFLPLEVGAEFRRYVELDAPCVIRAARLAGDGRTVLVTGHQVDELAFTATVTGVDLR